MIDFEKIDHYLELIEEGKIPTDTDFNQFALDFFKAVQTIPLSKYLRKIQRTSKLPKIMNMKKAGEVIYYSEKDEDVKIFLKRKGYKELPQMNYKSIMLLRKVEPLDNWMKILQFYEGKKTIQEITSSLKPKLLPIELEKLELYIMKELKLSEKELNWLVKILFKVSEDKQLENAIKKIINNNK